MAGLDAALDLHYAGLLADARQPDDDRPDGGRRGDDQSGDGWSGDDRSGGGWSDDLGLVGPDAFRAAMAALPTGVSVLTTRHDGGVWGMTVGSLTSLSLRPPLLLVCLRRGSTSLELLAERGRFAVSVLAADQGPVADAFARPRDPGTAAESCAELAGLPVVDGALAWFTCRHRHTYLGGDHAIVIGAVEHATHRDGDPLVRHASRYHRLHPSTASEGTP
ncbi:flavin reductase family protein [Micromonospora cathayae]|uniref:Flavin reductase family protein n=1 Tax=Micromonospora cathayae TaxID=3028804 RepID=A0ABY7ZJZ0_9ACTN|nr:flavin reductase family protein [Micromonospora sp. HUAS 3]WDZ82833.1 flavin reductase family protein [Micromonospora sp. HUAS 3]